MNFNQDKTIRRLGPPCGCPAGGPHECGLGLELPCSPGVTCWICASLGIPELRLMGWRHNGCIHTETAA